MNTHGKTGNEAKSGLAQTNAGSFITAAQSEGKMNVADNAKASAAWADYENKSNREWAIYQAELKAARVKFDAACRASGDKYAKATGPLWTELTAKLAAFDREQGLTGTAPMQGSVAWQIANAPAGSAHGAPDNRAA